MKYSRIVPTAITAAIIVLTVAATGHPAETAGESALSYQGFSGIINTPTAHVQAEGTFQGLYNNQANRLPAGIPPWQDNYVFSVGLFKFVEFGGRLTNGGARDLSANVKASTAALTGSDSLIPVFAMGVQDVGGGANLLQSRYMVASEDLWRFRLSAGYGLGPSQMKGAFGGVQLRLHDSIYLLGDYDARDINAGLRLISPELWSLPVKVTFSAKTTVNSSPGKVDLAFGLTFLLDFQKKSREASREEKKYEEHGKPVQAQGATSGITDSTPAPRLLLTAPRPATLSTLQTRLLAAGFINLRVGHRGSRELIVEYENVLFNHNELDAIGVVAGIVSESAPDSFETVRFIIKRKGIRMAVISAPLRSLRTFMEQPEGVNDLKELLTVSSDTDITSEVTFVTEQKENDFPSTALILAPGLMTFVGTDFGAFDYLLSVKPEIISDLWSGGVLNARWDIPLSWSENLDQGKPYYNSRRNSRMDRLMLFQGVKPAPGIMANFGGGMILHDVYGTLNEALWSPGDGTHRVRGVQAWAHNPETHRDTEVYLGSYRYFLAPLDLSLELTAGRFWGQDHGYSLEMKRFFGDTSVSTYYKDSTTSEGKHWQAAGIQFSFPLTPRKDLHVGPIQVRGSDEWSYGQETTLAIGGQKTNDVLTQSLAINPQPTPALYRAYYNRDRLSAAYISQHLDRLRDAWLKYCECSRKKEQ